MATDRLRARPLACALLVVASGAWAGSPVRVGLYQNLPKVGWSEEGKPEGIFVDLIEAIAAREGWSLTYLPGTWAEGLDRLRSGEIDLMPDVAPTPQRETLYVFHEEPVLSDWFQVYARRGLRIRSVLDLEGRRVALLHRSIQEETFRDMVAGFGLSVTLIPFGDYASAFACAGRGEADAVIANRFYGAFHAREAGLEDTAIIFHPGSLYFAASAHAPPGLLEAIDRYLREAKGDKGSVYHRSLRRWLPAHVERVVPGWVRGVFAAGALVLGSSVAVTLLFRHRAAVRRREVLDSHASRRQAEEALVRSEAKYRTLFETADDAILLMREDAFLECNPRALAMFGCERDQLVGAAHYEFSPPTQPDGRPSREKALEMIRLAYAEGPQSFEWVHCRKDGTPFVAEVSLNRLELGGEVLLQAIVRDVTRRKQAEEQIRRLNEDLERQASELERRVAERTAELADALDRAQAADRLKSAFLATMSHELRTPLNSIIGFTGILLQELAGPLNEEQRTQLEMVRSSARHLLALINDVLDISKIEAGQMVVMCEPFDLASTLERVASFVRPLAQKKGLALRLEIGEGVGILRSDPRRVEQVLLNLVHNAIKFTERGGVTVTAAADEEGVSIAVADTGIGIPEEDLARVFEPFTQVDTRLTRRYEGTGLGLAISRRLTELMGGRLRVESEVGRGSTFVVRLPLIPPGGPKA